MSHTIKNDRVIAVQCSESGCDNVESFLGLCNCSYTVDIFLLISGVRESKHLMPRSESGCSNAAGI